MLYDREPTFSLDSPPNLKKYEYSRRHPLRVPQTLGARPNPFSRGNLFDENRVHRAGMRRRQNPLVVIRIGIIHPCLMLLIQRENVRRFHHAQRRTDTAVLVNRDFVLWHMLL